jgi:hypothetical protein
LDFLGVSRNTGILSTERRVYELHPVAFTDGDLAEVLSVNISPVYFNDDGGIVFLCAVEQVLHRYGTAFQFFGKTVEDELQSKTPVSDCKTSAE